MAQTEQTPGARIRVKMAERGLNTTRLAREARLTRNTVAAALADKPVRNGTLDRIARTLGCDAGEFFAPTPAAQLSPDEQRQRLAALDMTRRTLVTPTRVAKNLSLVAHRYGLSSRSLIEAAPLAFTLLAELSLQKRREAVARIKDKVNALRFGDLDHLTVKSIGCLRLDEAIWAEESSIDARDLDGTACADADRDSGPIPSPMVAFVADLMEKLGLSDQIDIDTNFNNSTAALFSDAELFRDDLETLTGGAPRATYAISHVARALDDLPKSLAPTPGKSDETLTRRIDWLARLVPEAEWEKEQARRAAREAEAANANPEDLL